MKVGKQVAADDQLTGSITGEQLQGFGDQGQGGFPVSRMVNLYFRLPA